MQLRFSIHPTADFVHVPMASVEWEAACLSHFHSPRPLPVQRHCRVFPLVSVLVQVSPIRYEVLVSSSLQRSGKDNETVKGDKWHITNIEQPLRYIHILPLFFFCLAQACLGNTSTTSHFSRLSLWLWWSVFWHFPSREGDLNSVCSPTPLPFTARLQHQ